MIAFVKHVAGILALVCLVALIARLASASIVILPADPAAAVAEADVIVVGTVSAVDVVAKPGGATETQVTVQVEERKRGDVGETVTLRELGGSTAAGGFVVPGAPAYRVGQRVLVLATKRADGGLRTHLLDMGRIELEKPAWWSSTKGLTVASSSAGDARLDAWKAGAAATGLALPSVAPMPTPTPGTDGLSSVARMVLSPAAFRFMGGKWVAPAQVVYDAQGDAKLGTAASARLMDASLASWVDASAVPLVKAGAGTRQGFTCSPGQMLVSFDDPKEEIEDPKGCSGVLAIGGFCADNPKPGEKIGAIRAGALVFNDGWATQCPQFWTESFVTEIGVHEVGHAIGLAHACDSGQACDAEGQAATMYWMAHFDGRGATLTGYDIGAARALYGVRATPVPTPSATATVAPTATPSPTAVATAIPTTTAAPGPKPRGGCGSGKKAAADVLPLMLGFAVYAARRKRGVS